MLLRSFLLGRRLTALMRQQIEIPPHVMEQLWLNFNQEDAEHLTFSMLIRMNAAWNDANFHLLAARANTAKNDAIAEKRDKEDLRIRSEGAYIPPLRPGDISSLSPESLLAKAIDSMSLLSHASGAKFNKENISAATSAAAAAIAAMAAMNASDTLAAASVADKLAAAAAKKKSPSSSSRGNLTALNSKDDGDSTAFVGADSTPKDKISLHANDVKDLEDSVMNQE